MNESPPANAGDMSLVPGPGRFHVPQSNKVHETKLPSPCAAATEARVPRALAVHQEKPQ